MKPLQRPRDSFPAFTLLDLLIVVAVCLALAAMVFPALARARVRSHRMSCTCSLKQVGIAFRTWSLDHQDAIPSQVATTNGGAMLPNGSALARMVFLVLSNELSTPLVLVCPDDQGRLAARNFDSGFSSTNLSYFVGLDAQDSSPQLLLSGDCNLTLNGAPLPSGLSTIATNQTLGWTAARHGGSGNVALADGSVQQFNNYRLSLMLRDGGAPQQRLALP